MKKITRSRRHLTQKRCIKKSRGTRKLKCRVMKGG